MVHEGVRKKCSICHKVLSDLNKHMRTVHGTYRRRAKIPKELIGEMDGPDTELTPQIYGSSQTARDDQDLDSEPEEDQDCDNDEPVIKLEPPPPLIPSAETATRNIPNFSVMKTETNLPSLSETTKFHLKDDRSTETIKEELGLSSGITLQKIVRPTKSPPKLLYCGPKEASVAPLKASTTPLSITPLVQKPPVTSRTETQSSNMVKITGKFSRKITELLPLKKTVQNV